MGGQGKSNILDAFLADWANQLMGDYVTFPVISSKGSKMHTYPRLFKLMRDRADRPNAKLGHVADGVEWGPGREVTVWWHGSAGSVETFRNMAGLNARRDLRMVYAKQPPRLDKNLIEAIDNFYAVLSDYVTSVEKRTHIARGELQKAFGAVQDLIVEATWNGQAESLTPNCETPS